MLPRMKLVYIPVRARAENIRMMLYYKKVPFIDEILSFSEFGKLQDSLPYEQLPVLEVEHKGNKVRNIYSNNNATLSLLVPVSIVLFVFSSLNSGEGGDFISTYFYFSRDICESAHAHSLHIYFCFVIPPTYYHLCSLTLAHYVHITPLAWPRSQSPNRGPSPAFLRRSSFCNPPTHSNALHMTLSLRQRRS